MYVQYIGKPGWVPRDPHKRPPSLAHLSCEHAGLLVDKRCSQETCARHLHAKIWAQDCTTRDYVQNWHSQETYLHAKRPGCGCQETLFWSLAMLSWQHTILRTSLGNTPDTVLRHPDLADLSWQHPDLANIGCSVLWTSEQHVLRTCLAHMSCAHILRAYLVALHVIHVSFACLAHTSCAHVLSCLVCTSCAHVL